MPEEPQDSQPTEPQQQAPAPPAAETPASEKGLFDRALADVSRAEAQDAPAAAPAPAPPGEQQAAPAPAQPDVLAYLKGQGTDLTGRFGSTDAFLQAAVDSLRQQEAVAPYLRSYLQHAHQFQEYLAERQKSQAAKAAEPKPWQSPYDRAEVQRLLADYYEKGEDGQLRPKPAAPADVLSKVSGYERWARDWGDRLVNDPQGALAPLIQEEARALIRQALADHEHRQQARAVLDRHAGWLYAKDAPPGRQVLTAEGQLFREKVAEAESLGVRDLEAQERYALSMVEAELLRRKQKPLEEQQAANRRVAGLNRRPNVTPAPAPHTGRPESPAAREGLGLVESLREALRDFSDQDMVPHGV